MLLLQPTTLHRVPKRELQLFSRWWRIELVRHWARNVLKHRQLGTSKLIFSLTLPVSTFFRTTLIRNKIQRICILASCNFTQFQNLAHYVASRWASSSPKQKHNSGRALLCFLSMMDSVKFSFEKPCFGLSLWWKARLCMTYVIVCILHCIYAL